MIRKTAYIALFSACTLVACQSSNEAGKDEALKTPATAAPRTESPENTDIAYVVAQNYFVKNTVKQGEAIDPKIETKEKFEALFGMATTMGKDGKPTEIDFAKQYVIAVIQDETDIATELKPVSLQKGNRSHAIVFTYQAVKGEKQSYTIRPCLIVIVDKTNDGTVVVKEAGK